MLAVGDTGRKKDRLTNRQKDRQTDRQTDRRTKRQTDRQTYRHTDIQTYTYCIYHQPEAELYALLKTSKEEVRQIAAQSQALG